ncbi:G protein-regulated inducer of neurite outgrowth 1 [Cynoglossus semilaevis]|uniref:G protein regulated inducer of neurite outgrowth 1 n=1 Tax=Cynoglossus semilaevis TaxID=244447 RepID=A0A3P8WIQ9_CYNSE|nr:G protein-regulated inducer of neurite outgrowth 1 [Cynoglossus semilaevis]
MGSLKDEMSLAKDHRCQEKMDEKEHTGASHVNAVPEGPLESNTDVDRRPELLSDAGFPVDGRESPVSGNQVLSGEEADDSDAGEVADVDATPRGQQSETTNIDLEICNQLIDDGPGAPDVQSESEGGIKGDEETGTESVLVPLTPDPRSPHPPTPAPFGQHHMRTQVSLEVVQCCSAATSPMTPPEGGQSFFFPSSFGGTRAVGSGTKDAELQVGQQVEMCSAATSPMTPKTPSTSAFPELVGMEFFKREGQVGGREDKSSTCLSKVVLTKTGEQTEESSSGSAPESGVTMEGSSQQCKQQRMGSLDQDITILVTQYGNNEEGEEIKTEDVVYSMEPEMVKIDECDEASALSRTRNQNPPQEKNAASSDSAGNRPITIPRPDGSSGGQNNGEESNKVSAAKPSIPESPAPFGCHNMRTQVSLEVVQCQSAATSPMTPPEGDRAFSFPSSFGKCEAVGTETKDVELQVGERAEVRSVATAPMTPRTPTTTVFSDIRKESRTGDKMVGGQVGSQEPEENKGKKAEEANKDDMEAKEKEEEKEEEKGFFKGEEPLQEVSWDEKGMTWEVYGAVVEVAVLGSAIQKHLEKQVKKQKPSMPPPPPLNPSAVPLTTEPPQGCSGSGKGRAGKRAEHDGKVSRRRRNPFRQLMENMQQPHCCSRAHTTE